MAYSKLINKWKRGSPTSTEWMGRYRPLVAALVMHTNVVAKGQNIRIDRGFGVKLSAQEWQTLEYIVENQGTNFSMIQISRALGIPQSSFSRIIGSLRDANLVVRCQSANNKKVIIPRPTELAFKVYSEASNSINKDHFQAFFDKLESVGDEDIRIFADALNELNRRLPGADFLNDNGDELIVID